MVRRTSKKQLEAERLERLALAEFRRTPRLVCVQFRHDEIEGRCALSVSENEEPEFVVMCSDRQYLEFMKQHYRDMGCERFAAAFEPRETVPVAHSWPPLR